MGLQFSWVVTALNVLWKQFVNGVASNDVSSFVAAVYLFDGLLFCFAQNVCLWRLGASEH